MKTLEPIIFLLAIIFGCTCKTYSANDLVLTDAKLQSYDLTYQRMPLSQGQGLTFKAYCSNVGSFDHTGVYVNLKIINSFSDTIYNNNSATISVLNSSTDSVEINTPFNASDPGRYTFLYTMYQDSIDDNPSNNIVSIKQDIMEHLFQRDDGNYTGNNSWMGSSSYSEIGNLYEFLSPCIITSASVVIDANTDPGALIFFSIYDYSLNIVGMTADYIVTADDLGDTVTLSFIDPVVVSSLEYYTINVCNYGSSLLLTQMAQSAPDLTSFFVDDMLNWYFIATVPMVRINTDESQNALIEFEAPQWTLYPNPSSSEIHIVKSSPDAERLEIRNLLGEVVHNETIFNSKSINIAHLRSATYLVTVGGQTRKLIKQ